MSIEPHQLRGYLQMAEQLRAYMKTLDPIFENDSPESLLEVLIESHAYLEKTKAPGVAAAAQSATSDISDELTIVLSAARLGLMDTAPNHPVYRLLLDIQSAGERAAWKNDTLMRATGR